MRATMPATLAILALTGVGAGVYFGRAAADEIDPFYYTTPWDTRGPSYASLTASPPSIEPPRMIDDGAGLPTVPFRGYAHVPVAGQADGLAEAYAAAVRLSAVETEEFTIPEPDPELAAALDEEMRRIERYATYPVSQDDLRTGHGLAISATLQAGTSVPMEATAAETGTEVSYPEEVAED